MPINRIEKHGDFTVMSNYHLRDVTLSNRACGLLSRILSLPDDWNFSASGLASLSRDGRDAVLSELKELEKAGYLKRRTVRDGGGRITDTEYTVYEFPYTLDPNNKSDEPASDKPRADSPPAENTAQLNTYILNTDKANIYHSRCTHDSINHINRDNEHGKLLTERERTKEKVRQNLEYDILCRRNLRNKTRIDEIISLITDVICSPLPFVRIGGEDIPRDYVRERLMSLTCQHIEYVFEAMKESAPKIRNIKAYLLSSLYNAPMTMDNYYSAQAEADLLGG